MQDARAEPKQALDLVRRQDGAEFSGVIAERVPGSHVVIVTIADATYRFEWAEVSDAGPRAEDPRLAAAPSTSPTSAAMPSASSSDTRPPLSNDEARLTLTSVPANLLWLSALPGGQLQDDAACNARSAARDVTARMPSPSSITEPRVRSVTVEVRTDRLGRVADVVLPSELSAEAATCVNKALVGQETSAQSAVKRLRFERGMAAPVQL